MPSRAAGRPSPGGRSPVRRLRAVLRWPAPGQRRDGGALGVCRLADRTRQRLGSPMVLPRGGGRPRRLGAAPEGHEEGEGDGQHDDGGPDQPASPS